MKMKNINGFTLIELLAVIVILAIIALIATPIVINIIEDAKKSANEISTKNYQRAVELAIADYQMTNPQDSLSGVYTISENGSKIKNNGIEISVDYDGNVNISGNIKVDENNQVTLLNLAKDGVIDTSTIPKICTYKSGTKDGLGSKYECEVKDGTKFNFYLLSKTDSTYTLMMDRNICSDGTAAQYSPSSQRCYVTNWGSTSTGPTNAMEYLNTATSTWYNIPNISVNYTDEGNLYSNIVTTNNVTNIYRKVATGVNTLTKSITNLKSRLISKKEFTTASKISVLSTALYDNLSDDYDVVGYWTMTSASHTEDIMYSDFAYYVSIDHNVVQGSTGSYSTQSGIGIRPIIELSKDYFIE